MSVGLVTAAALLGAVTGALAGRAAPALARRFPPAVPEPVEPDGHAALHDPAAARPGADRPARVHGRAAAAGPEDGPSGAGPAWPRGVRAHGRAAVDGLSGAGPVWPRGVRAHDCAAVDGLKGGPSGAGPGWPRGVRAAGRSGAAGVVGAVVLGGLAVALGADPALPAFLLVAAGGLVLAVVDVACRRLPDPLVAATAVAGGAGLVVAALVAGTPGRLAAALAGAALSLAGYVALALLPGSRLGFGDVKLAAALGLPLGWLGWSALGLGLLLPHLLQGVVVLALLATRRVRRDTPLPFGPAILAGGWLAVLLA
ncbi:prepilin peptidase [Micromonospora coxensis]|uniref:Leader peptidase (Prepilin peptidase) / N-methyltransferase n=1 Tax=Micromonospora coxensis TaxID=356852 RepID=A0A1C5IPG7_9ACTN|nr:A24 family peptidase [Micromonospora coxensis]SCG60185.1 leader peptidase (prepilin peptidase) / N-methyltransferase [Micromonospora coxensis]